MARRATKRRTEPLPDVADATDPFAAVEWRDLRAALDVELAALPNRLRTPLVLCYLDGMTRDEAASRLGSSLRTLHRRLDEGRRRLRDRLTRRGLAPVLLGAAALSVDGLRAEVPMGLCQAVVNQATGTTGTPAAVGQLLTAASGIRGTLMKTLVALAIVAGGFTAVVAVRQSATAETIPVVRSSEAVRTPLPKEPPTAEALADKVAKTKTAAVAWLIKQQNADGSWGKERRTDFTHGGETALAVVALLESGLKADDESVKLGLKYLRGITARGTYVVSLQTQAFCLTSQKEDVEAIKANVKWLEKALNREAGGRPVGWSYGSNGGEFADLSNTRYAVSGLYAADKAGFKAERMIIWEELRALFLRTQFADGGWGYVPKVGKATQTMTCSGLLCLAQIEDVLGKKHDDIAVAKKKGFGWLAEHFSIADVQFHFYFLDVLARVGIAARQDKLGEGDQVRDWRREGSDWLVKQQYDDGHFRSEVGLDGPVISTAFALRFLHAQEKLVKN
jgi:hypothetical protein